MAIYVFHCRTCGSDREELRTVGETTGPECCGTTMLQAPTCQAMVKMKGMGGYPARRKQLHGSAPFTTCTNYPAFGPPVTA